MVHKDKIDIALICDDNYAMPTVVTIMSLIKNIRKDIVVYIHICCAGISEESKQVLNRNYGEHVIVKIYDRSCNEEYIKRIETINQRSHVTPTALLKFELANILKDIDQVLYIDSDIIVRGDISSIFSYNYSKYYAGAVFEFWKFQSELYKYDKFKRPEFYFNSGVMMLNLNKIRNDNIVVKLWQTKNEDINDINNKSQLMDQDVFNKVFKKQILNLPIKYNCNVSFTHNVKIEHINQAYGTKYLHEEDIYNDAIVLHYVGKKDKPWRYKNADCVNEWDKYYIICGFDVDKLDRKCYKKSLWHKILTFKKKYDELGIRKAVRYSIDRIKHDKSRRK